jgi:flagellar hook-basal body complex protein FliE
MNVTLKPFDFAQAVARAGLTTSGQPLQGGKAVPGAGFQQALTMVAMQKAQIGFQATLQVRNKLVQAYSDIMSMQV